MWSHHQAHTNRLGSPSSCSSYVCYRSCIILCSRVIVCGATVSGNPTKMNLLPVLSNIEGPQVLRDRTTLQEYNNAQQLMDLAPIKEIPCEPPKSRLRYHRPSWPRPHDSRVGIKRCKLYRSSRWENERHPDMISRPTQRVRNLASLYRDVTSSPGIVCDVARPESPNLSTGVVWTDHLFAPATRVTMLQSA